MNRQSYSQIINRFILQKTLFDQTNLVKLLLFITLIILLTKTYFSFLLLFYHLRKEKTLFVLLFFVVNKYTSVCFVSSSSSVYIRNERKRQAMSSPSCSSLPCVAEKCEMVSLALCQCCKKNLCIDHLNEHANQRNEKLLPFVDKINVLLARFNQLNSNNNNKNDDNNNEQTAIKQFEQWKQDAYKKIDEFYEKKCREFFGNNLEQQREQLNQMQSRLTELIRKKGGTQQDFDAFEENMNSIEQYLDKLEQSQIAFPVLTIDDNCLMKPIEQQTNEQSSKEREHSVEKSSKKSSKKKKKSSSSRRSNDSSDRSSRYRSRSPRRRSSRSRRSKFHSKKIVFFLFIDFFVEIGRNQSSDSNSSRSSNSKKSHCEDCHGCRFYQDRFGPGFMDAFGPCSCDCHKWAYS